MVPWSVEKAPETRLFRKKITRCISSLAPFVSPVLSTMFNDRLESKQFYFRFKKFLLGWELTPFFSLIIFFITLFVAFLSEDRMLLSIRAFRLDSGCEQMDLGVAGFSNFDLQLVKLFN